MKKDDLIMLFIALLLLAGMLLTILFGGEKSRHGVGGLLDEKPGQKILAQKKARLDLGQSQALPVKV
jgi:hypothetical protein